MIGEEAKREAWYAVYLKHQHEKTAADLLSRKGFETFLPVYKAAHRWKDRTKIVSLPLFPCYMFLRTGLDRKLDILRTPGVFWLVGNSGQASPVDESEIDALRKIGRSGAQTEPHAYLQEGDRVKVVAGSLAGVTGVLIRAKNRYRVVVSVELLRKAVAVEVDRSMLEPLENGLLQERSPKRIAPLRRSLGANE